MSYKSKRLRTGLSVYTVAKELGISEKTYREIEDKRRNLEGNMLDKFHEIIKQAKEIKFNRKQKMQEIDNWIKDGSMLNDIRKMNYTQKELADVLEMDQATISTVANNKRKCSDDLKEKIYDFLQNPLNKKLDEPVKVEKKKNVKKSELTATKIEDVKEWIKKGDMKTDIAKMGYNCTTLAKEIGVHCSIINRLANNKKDCSDKLAIRIYDFLQNPLNSKFNKKETPVKTPIKTPTETSIKIENSELTIDELKELSTEKNEREFCFDSMFNELIELRQENEKLKRQINLYEKLIERL